jgi:hypothetical protein
MPDGLQVTSYLASWDQATGDLILNITIENQTEQEKSAWYLRQTYTTPPVVLWRRR